MPTEPQERETEYPGWHAPFRPDTPVQDLPRQPHAGSTLLVLAVFGVSMLVVGSVAIMLARKLHGIEPSSLQPYGHPLLSVVIEFFAYACTAAAAYPVLRMLWQRPVGTVLQMNWPAARRRAPWLIGTGLVLSLTAQFAASRMSLPKDLPIDKFFTDTLGVWLMAIFGTVIAPLAEEIFFRGFLLKTFAIAFDWTRHFLGEAERDFWQHTRETSRPGWIFGAVLSSALFAAMHAAQLGFAWNAVAMLSLVGLALAAVRIRFQSVWASTLVHMGYNGLIFALIFFATDGYRHLDKLQR